MSYPHWMYIIFASREALTPHESVAILLGERPDTCNPDSMEYRFASDWLSAQDLPLVRIPVADNTPQIDFAKREYVNPPKWYALGYRAADLVAAIKRQREPRPFGQDALDAFNALPAPESESGLDERRKSAYLEFVESAKKSRYRRRTVEKLFEELCARDADGDLWRIELKSFRRNFWQNLEPEEQALWTKNSG